MGSGSSVQRTKTLYLAIGGKEVSIVFSPHCSSRDLKELLTSAAGLSKWASITLTTPDGSLLAITSSLPSNTPATRYQLNHVKTTDVTDKEVFHDVLSKVGEEFTKAFHIQEFTSEFSSRLEAMERRLEAEGMKAVEIERCKQELVQLKGQFMNERAKQRSLEFEQLQSQARGRRDIPPYPKYILTEETIRYLKMPTFDIWHWEPNEMLSLVEHMYGEFGLVTALHINPITLKRWLRAVQDNYHDNPFHNFRHCFCVTQMIYGMIHLCNVQDTFTKLEVAMLLTSAVCHDLDHPGLNNNYQINARTELALRYNDISPLENHHCAVTFQILERPDTNIFAYTSPEDFKRLRAGMIELILATDMARHAEYMDKFKSVLSQGFDWNNDEHRRILQIVMMKCCDVSNEVRPHEVSDPWVDCLLEEYFQQCDRERSEGLPVAPFMDRDKVTKATAQIGFIKYVLIPIFESISKLFPQLECAMVQTLRSSLERYEQLKNTEDMLKEDSEENAAKAKPSAKRCPGNTSTSSDANIVAALKGTTRSTGQNGIIK